MAENYSNGSRLTRYTYAPNPDDFESGQLNPSLMNRINYESESSESSEEDAYEYTLKKEEYYKKLFTKPLKKIRFSVSTSDRDRATYPDSHDCKIILNGSNNINEFNNVVGFNIIEACIPVSYYNINLVNRARLTSSGTTVLNLIQALEGYYSVNNIKALHTNITYDSNTGKFTISGEVLSTLGDTSQDRSIAKVLGLGYDSVTKTYKSSIPLITDIRGTGFYDIEVGNIPSINCLHTNYSKNVIVRIPMTDNFSGIINYSADLMDLNSNNFFPIKLTHLDIRVLDEFGNAIDLNGLDFNITCEVTLLGDLPEDM
jgi:hypothetical protein